MHVSGISTYIIIIYLLVTQKKFQIYWGFWNHKCFYYSRGMQIIMKHRGGHIKFETHLYVMCSKNAGYFYIHILPHSENVYATILFLVTFHIFIFCKEELPGRWCLQYRQKVDICFWHIITCYIKTYSLVPTGCVI